MMLDAEMAEIAKIFFQESREGLDVMEAGLLGLGGAADADAINTIFRAAHSIKGGAATFGFTEVAQFTHGVETLLDEMRNGVRPVTSEAIQTLLQSCDCMREMIAATEAGHPLDAGRIAVLNGDIAHILGDSPGYPGAGPPDTESSVDASGAPPAEQARSPAAAQGWRIAFEPVADLLRLRNEPIRMFTELQRLGRLSVRLDASRIPALEALDPEACYLGWELELEGAVARQQLEDVFDWVDSRCRLEFTPRPPAADGGLPEPCAAAPAASAAPPAAVGVTAVRPAPPVPPAPGGTGSKQGAPAAKSSAESASIRVATEKLDNIINLVGELLITQSMLTVLADDFAPGKLDRLRKGLSQLARNTRELQESVMQIRMLPISFAFNRFPRLVHDLSRKLEKSVEIKLTGESTELDKTVLEKISDPLVHLVRNALDHGLETPEQRAAAGKAATGIIELSAFHEGGSIIIEVRDDGAGLNRARILSKARERGLVADNQELTDEQIHSLIFMPGFSTAQQVSDVSGRGVGMDVVRKNINDLGGYVQIFSTEGQGSTVRIRLPLTLAILDGQLVRVGKEIYVISLLAIVETIQVSRERLNTILGGSQVFRLRDEFLPVVRLGELFAVEGDSANPEDGLLVVVEADDKRVCLLVDDLLAQQQVVIKSLESNFKPVPGVAGATILGDGAVALIIEVRDVIRAATERSGDARSMRAA
ncbi:MAG TPA: chemotaxis protein CheA [Steroidobacteraceae bacterium]|nr:chemotaxis protein CheA [Steroidobacteraceae bacterium]